MVDVLINGSPHPIDAFLGQDNGAVDPEDSGRLIVLSGNAWKQARLPVTVTAETVLRLDFTPVAGGEIHGIAFETDGKASQETLFQFFGTQNYGIQDFHTAQLGVTSTYEIRVGEYFTGLFDRLVFVSDDDLGQAAVSEFGAVELTGSAVQPAGRIVYFGDSLGDSDEFWRLSEQILVDPLPDPNYYAQQFSNGEVKTDVLTRLLGYEGADPVSGQDYNYAVGGARAIGPLTAGDFVDDEHELRPDLDPALLETRIDLSAQTDRFLSDAAAYGWDLSSFTAHLLIGINDLSNWEPDSIWPWQWDNEIADLVRDIIATIETNVRKLLDAGVGAVWVETQPDVAFFPVYAEIDWLTRLLSDGVIDDFNAGLVQMVEGLGDERVHVLDLDQITDEIEDDPLNFGRVDIENSVLLGKAGSYDPELNPALPADFDFATDANDYGFIDYVHPTEGTHRILGIFEAEAMQTNLIAGGSGADVLRGTNHDDLVLGSGGNDSLRLRDGDDVAIGGTGHDTIEGGGGSDLVSGGAGNDVIRGGIGRDLLTGGYGNDQVDAGRGGDLLIDTAGSDILSGGDGDDFFLWFQGSPLLAAQGTDRIIGGSGADTLFLYLADTASYEAVLGDYSSVTGGEFTIPTLDLEVSGVERLELIDLSVRELELPDTDSLELGARMDEWQLWDFA